MKRTKIFFAIAAVLMMCASCMKSELMTDSAAPNLIGIRPVTSVATKAATDGTEFPEDLSIVLSAYYNAAEGTSGNFFKEITFSKGDAGTWVSDKYWPLSGTLDFLAASYEGLTVTNVTYGDKVTEGVSFDVPDNSSIQSDIMVGSAQKQIYKASGTPLVFNHAQALLVFTASSTIGYDATTNVGVSITGITVRNAKYSGNLTISAIEDDDDGYCVWADLDDQKDVDLPGVTDYIVPTVAMDITEDGNHMGIGGVGLLVPEQEQTSFTVFYTLHNGMDKDGDPLDAELQYTYACSDDWVEGKKYNYILAMNVNKMTVTPVISEWAAEDVEAELGQSTISATYSVSGETAVTLPEATMSEGTKMQVNWGDGTVEKFDNLTKSTLSGNTLTLSHTYSSAYTGDVTLSIKSGSLDFDILKTAIFNKFIIYDDTKVIMEEKGILLKGVFTVNSSGKKVKFSAGNLMANVNAAGTAVTEWKLADNQYDYVGNVASNQQCKNGWVDLFGWTKAGKYSDGVKQYGINISKTSSDYGSSTSDACCDWGSLIDPCLTMLTKAEWEYLKTNKMAKNSSNQYLFTIAGKSCIILKPDGYTGTVANTYTADTWKAAEEAGLVAIPCAGYRNGSSVSGVGTNGSCWSCTPTESLSDDAYYLIFNASGAFVGNDRRCYGYSVRLVSVQ